MLMPGIWHRDDAARTAVHVAVEIARKSIRDSLSGFGKLLFVMLD